jgi:hypothetical protein
MTSESTRDPVADALLTPQNFALVVIDYQPSQVQTVASIDHDLLTRNRTGTVPDVVEIVLTSRLLKGL